MKSIFITVFETVTARKRLILAVFLLLIFAAVWYLNKNYFNIQDIIDIIIFLQSHTFLVPILFIFFYALMVVFLLVTLPLNLAAGFLWGPFWGGIITIFGASLGALLAFLISRYILRGYLNTKFQGEKWALFQAEIQKSDWKIIAFMRINPIFPFGLTNYFLGTTTISPNRYLLSTAIFISPLAFLFAFVGDLVGGFILGAKEFNFVRDILIISLGVTIFIAGSWTLNFYFKVKNLKSET